MPEKSYIAALKKYLSTPERPVSMTEFKEFWNSCTEEEKERFKEEFEQMKLE